MRWSPDGARIVSMCKKGQLNVFDPRNPETGLKATAHLGPKPSKAGWIDDNTIITTGTTKMNEREWMSWDTRNMSKVIAKGDFPSGVGAAHLHVDRQHKIVFVDFRGELNIGIYAYHDDGKLKLETNMNNPAPTKGFAPFPKWTMDPKGHEVHRFARVDNKGKLEYISFRLQNRTGLFQPELYKPFESNNANGNYESWAAGENKPPNMMELTEDMAPIE